MVTRPTFLTTIPNIRRGLFSHGCFLFFFKKNGNKYNDLWSLAFYANSDFTGIVKFWISPFFRVELELGSFWGLVHKQKDKK